VQPRSKNDCSRCAGVFDVEAKIARLDELEKMSGEADFWLDADKAQRLLKERNDCAVAVETVEPRLAQVADIRELVDMAEAEGDSALLDELQAQIYTMNADLEKAEFARAMSGSADRSAAILQINAGAGGTESADWASMLMRMYTR